MPHHQKERSTFSGSIGFVLAAAGSAITATATIVKSGRQLSVADVEVYDADSGKMVAKMLSTMVVQKTEG